VKEHLRSALVGLDADYVDTRHEESRKTRILFRGKKLETIAENAASGGHVRAYARGGKATASVSDLDLLASTARATAVAASLAGSRRAERRAARSR
jgi:predicted Zn-dependent protease